MQAQSKPQASVNTPVIVTATYLIQQLTKYAQERQYALSHYPNAKGVPEKMLAIAEIFAAMELAKNQPSSKEAAKTVLHQLLNFGFIAPTGTRMLYQRYTDKISDIMLAFKNVLV